jgi:hypothetical protein
MSPRANVRSLDAIRQFRPAVIRFGDDVTAALTGLRTELNRTLQWLDHDCPTHWQQQVRNGFDKVNEARTQLSRKQMMTIGGRHPDCIEEKKALVRTKQHLELAQEKVKLCRQWSIKAHRAADEYQSRIGRAEQAIVQGIPRMLAILERIVLALEQYTATEGPSRSEPHGFEPLSVNEAAPPGAAPQSAADAATQPAAEAAAEAATEAETASPLADVMTEEP